MKQIMSHSHSFNMFKDVQSMVLSRTGNGVRIREVEYDDGRKYRILSNEVLGSGAQARFLRP